jgi:hypothetical protein
MREEWVQQTREVLRLSVLPLRIILYALLPWQLHWECKSRLYSITSQYNRYLLMWRQLWNWNKGTLFPYII